MKKKDITSSPLDSLTKESFSFFDPHTYICRFIYFVSNISFPTLISYHPIGSYIPSFVHARALVSSFFIPVFNFCKKKKERVALPKKQFKSSGVYYASLLDLLRRRRRRRIGSSRRLWPRSVFFVSGCSRCCRRAGPSSSKQQHAKRDEFAVAIGSSARTTAALCRSVVVVALSPCSEASLPASPLPRRGSRWYLCRARRRR